MTGLKKEEEEEEITKSILYLCWASNMSILVTLR